MAVSQEGTFHSQTSRGNSGMWRHLPTLFMGAMLVGSITFIAYAWWALPTDTWLYAFLWEREAYQHVNLASYIVGLAMLVWLLLKSQRERSLLLTADRVMRPLIEKWRTMSHEDFVPPPPATAVPIAATKDKGLGIGGVKQSPAAPPAPAQGPSPPARDQGQDILDQMVEVGVARRAESSTASPRLSGQVSGSLLFQRMHRLALYLKGTKAQNVAELMDMNRDLASLDAEQLSGRFSMVKYIVYLIPVVGFMGTVGGIGQALGAIADALPRVSDLQGFIASMGNATGSLQVAFDSTLLSLILAGILTLAITVARNSSDDLLGAIDTWIIDNLLRHITENSPLERELRRGFSGIIDALQQLTSITQYGASASQSVNESVQSLVSLQQQQSRDTHDIVKAVTSQAGAVVEELRAVGQLCRDIRTSQAEGVSTMRGLAGAVQKLPDFANALDTAAQRLTRAVTDLSGMSDAFSGLGHINGALKTGISALDDIRHSLRGELPGDDGQPEQVVAVVAIHQMRKVLAEQMDRTSRDSAQQISTALSQVAQANTLLRGSMEGMDRRLGALVDAFVELSNAIKASQQDFHNHVRRVN